MSVEEYQTLKAVHAERNIPMSPAAEETLRYIQHVQTELGIQTDNIFSDKQEVPKRPCCFERTAIISQMMIKGFGALPGKHKMGKYA